MPVDWKSNLDARLKEKAQGNAFTLAQGDNIIRILPHAKSSGRRPFATYYAHGNVGPHKRLIRCGKNPDTDDGACWLCDSLIPKLERSGSKSQQGLAKLMSRKERVCFQVAWLDKATGRMLGPKFLFFGASTHNSAGNRLLRIIGNPKISIEDPQSGYNISVSRSGQGFSTSYEDFQRDDTPSEVPQEILNKIRPFSDAVVAYSEEDQRLAYRGRQQEESVYDEEGLDDDEKPTARRALPADDDDDEGLGTGKKSREAADDNDYEESDFGDVEVDEGDLGDQEIEDVDPPEEEDDDGAPVVTRQMRKPAARKRRAKVN
jgi:hypothetical protein